MISTLMPAAVTAVKVMALMAPPKVPSRRESNSPQPLAKRASSPLRGDHLEASRHSRADGPCCGRSGRACRTARRRPRSATGLSPQRKKGVVANEYVGELPCGSARLDVDGDPSRSVTAGLADGDAREAGEIDHDPALALKDGPSPEELRPLRRKPLLPRCCLILIAWHRPASDHGYSDGGLAVEVAVPAERIIVVRHNSPVERDRQEIAKRIARGSLVMR